MDEAPAEFALGARLDGLSQAIPFGSDQDAYAVYRGFLRASDCILEAAICAAYKASASGALVQGIRERLLQELSAEAASRAVACELERSDAQSRKRMVGEMVLLSSRIAAGRSEWCFADLDRIQAIVTELAETCGPGLSPASYQALIRLGRLSAVDQSFCL